ncbi:hypothetical protein KY290_004160 [Solanum tuberosum]|uniref:Pentatricopeptide repeat-containing protein n=1 Tax=Solanum tuberosum TaxID=4113 RepID=A0ABQ7WX53_SOLTU|nr:hypothetical protein KY290_004160 [Solanum tuberosum]
MFCISLSQNLLCPTGTPKVGLPVTKEDIDLLQFSENLEFLEAEYFLWAVHGYGLDIVAPELAMGGPPPIGVRKANLDFFTSNIINEFAMQEVGHLRALRSKVGGLPRPLMDLSSRHFAHLFDEAFGYKLQPPFDPYRDSLNFMLSCYALPYAALVGYVGTNPLIQGYESKRLLAGLLGVESGQDAMIRMYLYERAGKVVYPYRHTVAEFTIHISNLRNRLAMCGIKDEGLFVPWQLGAENRTTTNILSADFYSLSQWRTPEEILRIMYNTGSENAHGGFFPRVDRQDKEPPSALRCYLIAAQNMPPILFIGNAHRAMETLSSMRNYNLVPDLPSWNRLLHHFNSAGLVDQVIILYSDMLACGVASNVVTRNIVVHSLCKVGKLEKALELLRENESDTVTYNTLIWGFCRIGFVEMGFGLVSDMLKKGIFFDTITCNILIKGFCDKGLLYNAESVMEMLSDKHRGVCKDVVGFNTLIHGYCKAVEMSGGFEMMERMKREGLSPDIVTYNTLINGFGIMGDFDAANCIMDELLDSNENVNVSYVGDEEKHDYDDGENKDLVVGDLGLEPNTITYTTLISKYVKWFQFEKAFATYEEMTRLGFFYDIVTYNSLIYGHCKNERFHEAKLLLDEMRRVGVDPNHVTYSIFIHHLYKNKAEKVAANFQSQIVIRGVPFDVVLFTSLINGLFKVGKSREAKDVFQTLLKSNITPNHITYTALVDGHCKSGDLKSVEILLQQMEQKGVLPNVVTFSSVINGYAKSGMVEAAIEIMRKMVSINVNPNVFTYNTLIDGFFKAGKHDMALALYEEMQSNGVEENEFLLDTFLNNLKKLGKMDEAEAIFMDMVSKGLSPDHVNYTSLMDGLFKTGKESDALQLVEEMKEKKICFDTIACNVLLNGLLGIGQYEVQSVYAEIRKLGLVPDIQTFNSLIDAYCKEGKLESAVKVWVEMKSSGIMPNSITCNILVKGLCEVGDIEKAMDLLTDVVSIGFRPSPAIHKIVLDAASGHTRADIILRMHERLVGMGLKLDQTVHNTLIAVLCKLGMTRKATSVLENMRERGFSADTTTYNAFIRGYCKSYQFQKVFATYSEMLAKGVPPNVATYNTMLASLSAVGLMNEAADLFNEMKGRGFVPNANTYDILVSGHGKIGNKKESIKLYCEMITKGFVPRTSTYNVLIFDFAKAGKMRQAQELMHEMQVRGVLPNSSTYDILLVGWCKLSKRPELERSLRLSCRSEDLKKKERNQDIYICFSRIFSQHDESLKQSFEEKSAVEAKCQNMYEPLNTVSPVFTKTYHMIDDDERPTFEWYYPSKGLTHKILKGNSKKGSKDAKPIIRTGTCKRFFNTFHPPQIGKDDDDNNEDVVDSTAFMLCCQLEQQSYDFVQLRCSKLPT